MGGILNAIQLSSHGLSVQRARMNATAENIANAETTRTSEGGPYHRKRVVSVETSESDSFGSMIDRAVDRLARTHVRHLQGKQVQSGGREELPSVEWEEISESDSYRIIHDPSHPDADEDGYVKVPDIEIVSEMVEMMAAARAYEANTVAIAAAKKMAQQALEI